MLQWLLVAHETTFKSIVTIATGLVLWLGMRTKLSAMSSISGHHIVVVAAVIQDDRLLLGLRSPNKAWLPNCWDLIGGHLEDEETPEEALLRECREELGILVTEYEQLGDTVDMPTMRVTSFVVTGWTGQLHNAAPAEHVKLDWFRAADVVPLVLADEEIRVLAKRA